MTALPLEETIETQDQPMRLKSEIFYTEVPAGKNVLELTQQDLAIIFEKFGIEPMFDEFFRIIGLFGSTHANAKWREVAASVSANPVFDPKFEGDNWKDEYAEVEAIFKRICGTVIYRLENVGTVNGSLGSIAEVTMNAMMAYLFGQRQIISIEENFVRTLTAPGAVVQYYTMLYVIENMHKLIGVSKDEFSSTTKLIEGNDLEALTVQADAELDQLDEITNMDHGYMLEIYKDTPKPRGLTSNSKIVLTGSGDSQRNIAANPQGQIVEMVETNIPGAEVTRFNTGDTAQQWNQLYADLTQSLAPDNIKSLTDDDYNTIQSRLFALLDAQASQVEKADVIVNIIDEGHLTKGGLTVTPAWGISHLYSGNEFVFLCEPLNLNLNLQKLFMKDRSNIATMVDLAEFDKMLLTYGITEEILITYDDNQKKAALDLLKAAMNGQGEWGPLFKKSIIGRMPAVIDIDNSYRARNLIMADWRRLKVQYPGLPYFENRDEFMEYMKTVIVKREDTEPIESQSSREVPMQEVELSEEAQDRLKFELQLDINDLSLQTKMLHAWTAPGLSQRLNMHVQDSISKVEEMFGEKIPAAALSSLWEKTKQANLANIAADKYLEQAQKTLISEVLESFVPTI